MARLCTQNSNEKCKKLIHTALNDSNSIDGCDHKTHNRNLTDVCDKVSMTEQKSSSLSKETSMSCWEDGTPMWPVFLSTVCDEIKFPRSMPYLSCDRIIAQTIVHHYTETEPLQTAKRAISNQASHGSLDIVLKPLHQAAMTHEM